MDALGYYPSSWDRIPLALSGLVAILLALVSLALIALRRDTLVARPQALAGGLCMALVWALACGNAFLYAQSLTGGPSFFLAPIDIRAGPFSGIGLGALAVLAIGAFVMFRSMATAGMMLGAAIGLVIFRLVFGPTAGFGGEVGFGVGQEVGVMCGAAGGLLGGILGSILGGFFSGERAASSREDGQQPMTSRDGSRLVVALAGLVGGGAVGGVVAETGANIGLFQFLIPYNAQVPDVAPDTSPTGLLHDFQFGLGLTSSSHSQVSGSPLNSTMAISTAIEAIMLRASTRVIESGRLARGKCRARISPRLPLTAWMPACTTDWV